MKHLSQHCKGGKGVQSAICPKDIVKDCRFQITTVLLHVFVVKNDIETLFLETGVKIRVHIIYRQARSQPVFSGKPEGSFCLSYIFISRNERNWMKKSARVSEKLVNPGLPGLQVAVRLTGAHYTQSGKYCIQYIIYILRRLKVSL